jgi:hypothetical protein
MFVARNVAVRCNKDNPVEVTGDRDRHRAGHSPSLHRQRTGAIMTKTSFSSPGRPAAAVALMEPTRPAVTIDWHHRQSNHPVQKGNL